MSRGVSSGFPYFLFYIKKIICSVFSVHFSLITWTGTSIFVFLGILLFLSNIFSPDRGWSDIGRPLLVVFHVCWVYMRTQCGVLYVVCRGLRRSVKNSNLFQYSVFQKYLIYRQRKLQVSALWYQLISIKALAI